MAPANSFSCRAHLQAARQGPDVAEHEVRDPVVLHRVVEGGPDRHALGVQQRGRELQLLLEAGLGAVANPSGIGPPRMATCEVVDLT